MNAQKKIFFVWNLQKPAKGYRHGAVDVAGAGAVVVRAALEVGAGGRVLQVDAAPELGLLARVAEPDLGPMLRFF
jgi:hypothetical protein